MCRIDTIKSRAAKKCFDELTSWTKTLFENGGLINDEMKSRVLHSPCSMPEPSAALTSSSGNLLPQALSTFEGRPPWDDDLLSQQEGPSELSPLMPQDDILDDLTRFITIVIPGNDERTHCAAMLIDSGDEHVNLISRKLVDKLGLIPSNKQPSHPKRVLNKLAPWTQSAKTAKAQANNRVRDFTGKEIPGQDGVVTLHWYGRNRSELRDPIVWFRPVRYKTTHVVVDADCASEVVLRWREIHHLRLRDRFASPIQRPPTPEPDQGLLNAIPPAHSIRPVD